MVSGPPRPNALSSGSAPSCRLCPSSPSISPPTTNTCQGRNKIRFPSAHGQACVPASCRDASTQNSTLLCAPRRDCTPIRRKRPVMHKNRASTFRPRPSTPSANAPRHDRRARHRTPSASCIPQPRPSPRKAPSSSFSSSPFSFHWQLVLVLGTRFARRVRVPMGCEPPQGYPPTSCSEESP